MSQACPLNFVRIDNTRSRLVSVLMIAVIGLFLLTKTPLWLLFASADLLMRLYGRSAFSPLFRLAGWLQERAGLPERQVDGAAKNVAGHFGLLFLALLILGWYLHSSVFVFAVSAVYIICLAMDAVLDFCVGCRIYHLYRTILSRG